MKVYIDADILRYRAAAVGDKGCDYRSTVRNLKQVIEATTGATPVAVLTHPASNKRMRYWWATTKPYQGNRKQQKAFDPSSFDRASEAIKELLPFKEVKDLEADDYLYDRCRKGAVILSPDKDLRQAEGQHLHPDGMFIFNVDWEAALFALSYQLLVGDKADNVPGAKVAPKKAEAMLRRTNNMVGKVLDVYSSFPPGYLAEQFALIALGSDVVSRFEAYTDGNNNGWTREVLWYLKNPPWKVIEN